MDCKQIGQEAEIVDINAQLIKLKVSADACGNCQLRGLCSTSKGRILEMKKPNYRLNIGDKVTLYMEESLGLKALFLSYILPFFILMIVLIIVKVITKNDAIAGLSALGSLIPYYLILALFKKSLTKKFKFTIKPQ